MNKNLYGRKLRKGLLDFHAGEAIPTVQLDIADYIAAVSKAGVQTLTFMTKDAFGNSYYDTRIGHKNSKLQGDLLAEAIREARKVNVDIIAYYNVGLNSHVARENPDYRQRNKEGMPVTEAYGYYDLLCMNTPYSEYVFDQLLEIASHYDVSGFFFDITYVWPTSCYCEYCRRWYQERFGRPIPMSPQPGTVELKQWQSFQREIRHNFLRDAVSHLKGQHPELVVGWNHAGDIRFGHIEADRFADYWASEFHPPHYLNGSLLAKWKRSFEKPFELMMPSEMGSWGEWTVSPAATLKTTAAIAVGNGGSINFGHVPYPSGALQGRVPDAVMNAIQEANAWVWDREPWLTEATSVPSVAVLYTIANKRMLEASALSSDKEESFIQGIHRILVEGNIHFDIIDDTVLESKLDQYELLLLPDQAYLSNTVQKCIRKYVMGGGCVLATNRTSLYDAEGVRLPNFGLADLFGVDFMDISPYLVSYLYPLDEEIADDIPDMPILLKGAEMPFLRANGKDKTRVLGKLMDPALEAKPHRHVYHQHAHPARLTEHTAIAEHKIGKGSCVYISGPIESAFWKTGSPWLRNIYLNCIKLLNPDPKMVVSAPIGVEVNLMRQRSRLIVHLTNLREEKAAGSKAFIENIIPVHDIEITLKTTANRVYLAPEYQKIPFKRTRDAIRFIVPKVDFHAMIVIESSGD